MGSSCGLFSPLESLVMRKWDARGQPCPAYFTYVTVITSAAFMALQSPFLKTAVCTKIRQMLSTWFPPWTKFHRSSRVFWACDSGLWWLFHYLWSFLFLFLVDCAHFWSFRVGSYTSVHLFLPLTRSFHFLLRRQSILFGKIFRAMKLFYMTLDV